MKVTPQQVAEILERLEAGERIKDLADEFGVKPPTICGYRDRAARKEQHTRVTTARRSLPPPPKHKPKAVLEAPDPEVVHHGASVNTYKKVVQKTTDDSVVATKIVDQAHLDGLRRQLGRAETAYKHRHITYDRYLYYFNLFADAEYAFRDKYDDSVRAATMLAKYGPDWRRLANEGDIVPMSPDAIAYDPPAPAWLADHYASTDEEAEELRDWEGAKAVFERDQLGVTIDTLPLSAILAGHRESGGTPLLTDAR